MSKKKQVGSSLFFLILGIALFIGSFFVKRLAGSLIGPEFLPRVVGLLMTVLSAVLLAHSLKLPADPAKAASEKLSFMQLCAKHRDILTMILIVAYVLTLNTVGFIVTTVIYLFLQMCLFRERTKKNVVLNLVISVATTIIIYFIFVKGLHLMLPSGILL